MQLKKLAVALGIAATLPAMAAINPFDDAELVLVVWNVDVGSYTLDTGLTINSLLAGAKGSFNVGAAYDAYSAAAAGKTSQYGFIAADGEGFGSPGEFRYITTTTNDKAPTVSNIDFNTYSANVSVSFVGEVNQTGTHKIPTTDTWASNGESFAKKGEPAAFLEMNFFGVTGTFAGIAIGTDAKLFYMTSSSFEPFDLATTLQLPGKASFDGRTVSVDTLAAPVPEPGTYALMLAGLAAVGGLVSRRRNRG